MDAANGNCEFVAALPFFFAFSSLSSSSNLTVLFIAELTYSSASGSCLGGGGIFAAGAHGSTVHDPTDDAGVSPVCAGTAAGGADGDGTYGSAAGSGKYGAADGALGNACAPSALAAATAASPICSLKLSDMPEGASSITF